jgi:hypothetical protein
MPKFFMTVENVILLYQHLADIFQYGGQLYYILINVKYIYTFSVSNVFFKLFYNDQKHLEMTQLCRRKGLKFWAEWSYLSQLA